MPDSVSLPFCVPVFSFTPGHAAAGFALNGHPTGYNAYLNQCTTVGCTRRFLRGFTTPQMGIPRAWIGSFPYIEHYSVSSRFGYPHYRNIIKLMLDQGFYVYFNGIDDFYMPGKCWYGIRHMAHDGIICGYDDNDQTYSIAAYDINWLFNLIKIPQECLIEGLNACIKNKQYGALTAYKMRENAVISLDEKMILQNLKTYVDQTVDKYPLEQDGWIEGIATHDFLAMYMDKLKDGSIPAEKVDWRTLRPVWEHKKCMLDRIKSIEEKRGWDIELSSKYAPLVDDANRARMMLAMFHKNQKATLLDKMKNILLDLRERESEILKELIKRMEEEGT